MEFSEPQVYQSAYALLLEVYNTTDDIPKNVRYTMVEPLKNVLVRILSIIHNAASNPLFDTPVKLQYVQQALDLMAEVNVRLRILSDTRSISAKRYGSFCKSSSSVTKQLLRWTTYLKDYNSKKSVP